MHRGRYERLCEQAEDYQLAILWCESERFLKRMKALQLTKEAGT